MGFWPLFKEGNIVGTDFAYNRVPRELDPFDDETFMASPDKFYAVVTDIESGEPEYVHIRSVFEQMDVLRASGSMPFVSKPVVIEGHKYLDGALGDNIPYKWMAEQEVDKMIVIVTRDSAYRKKPANKLACGLYRRKFPALEKALLLRPERYNAQVEELQTWEQQGKAFVIRPTEPITIGRIERNSEKLQAVYDLGVRDAENYMEALQAYLK